MIVSAETSQPVPCTPMAWRVEIDPALTEDDLAAAMVALMIASAERVQDPMGFQLKMAGAMRNAAEDPTALPGDAPA
jgi:hypothetical protein